MTALIIGSNGQDGYFLSQVLIQNQVQIVGVSRKNAQHIGNVGDYEFISSLIKKYQPEYIFHLAANSTSDHSAIWDNHNAITTGTLNVLESVRLYSPHSRVFISGSALQFVNNGTPINESNRFDANSIYSASRISSVYTARYYRQYFNLQVYVGYFFNHDSELRGLNYINQKIIYSAKQIASNKIDKVEVRDISVKKEFNYAVDLMNAVWILVNQQKYFEVVIGCGQAHSIQDWIEIIFAKINKDWRKHIIISDISKSKILISDPKNLYEIGWRPQFDIYSLADIMWEKFDMDKLKQ